MNYDNSLNKKTFSENISDNLDDYVKTLKEEKNMFVETITDPIYNQFEEVKWMIQNDKNHINTVIEKISIRGKITLEGIKILKDRIKKKIIKPSKINKTIHNSKTAIINIPNSFTKTIQKELENKINMYKTNSISDEHYNQVKNIIDNNPERTSLEDRYKKLENEINLINSTDEIITDSQKQL